MKKIRDKSFNIDDKLKIEKFYFIKYFENKKKKKLLWNLWKHQKSKLLHLFCELNIEEINKKLLIDESEKKYFVNYELILELYNILGISNSVDNEKIFRTEDFEKKKETLQPIINKLFKKLNIRDYNKYKTFKYSEGVKIKNEINKILKSWTGSSFKLHKRITENKKKCSLFCIENMTGIDKGIIEDLKLKGADYE
jgi:hypothetical protein